MCKTICEADPVNAFYGVQFANEVSELALISTTVYVVANVLRLGSV